MGGISNDHKVWINSRYRFFLPVGVLKHVFREKLLSGYAVLDSCRIHSAALGSRFADSLFRRILLFRNLSLIQSAKHLPGTVPAAGRRRTLHPFAGRHAAWCAVLLGMNHQSVLGLGIAVPLIAMTGLGLFFSARFVTPPPPDENRRDL